MKRLLIVLLCVCLVSGIFPSSVFANPDWPANVAIEAEGGIVIEAETGAVLYGTNIHEQYFPASITKILTALIILENCDLDDIVTFSRNAVYNVEPGSSNMAMDTGDQLTVRDCLYGMMLQSANEAANALAEHAAGSIEAFAVMMNEKAKELGCQESNFVNPSGLNDPDHKTSAYDMALISKAAFKNQTFVEIDSTIYYDIPATKRNPEGLRIYTHHKMLKKNESVYYPGMIGGKTGYTSLAGNTLVSYAEKDGVKLITVILNGHQSHYRDTKNLMDFGFSNFQSIPATKIDATYLPIKNDMLIAGLTTTDLSSLYLDETSTITIPKSADLSNITSELMYSLDESAPSGAIAKVQYRFGERKIGLAYLLLKETDTNMIPETDFFVPDVSEPDSVEDSTAVIESNNTEDTAPTELEPTSAGGTQQNKHFFVLSTFWIVIAAIILLVVLIIILILLKIRQDKKEEEARLRRRQRRLERLGDIPPNEFEQLLQKKRASSLYSEPETLKDKFKRFFNH